MCFHVKCFYRCTAGWIFCLKQIIKNTFPKKKKSMKNIWRRFKDIKDNNLVTRKPTTSQDWSRNFQGPSLFWHAHILTTSMPSLLHCIYWQPFYCVLINSINSTPDVSPIWSFAGDPTFLGRVDIQTPRLRSQIQQWHRRIPCHCLTLTCANNRVNKARLVHAATVTADAVPDSVCFHSLSWVKQLELIIKSKWYKNALCPQIGHSAHSIISASAQSIVCVRLYPVREQAVGWSQPQMSTS